jgi:23S rRNA (cytidine1920-2'-O)/16S rRNA (cytidine1409-2'-O)-methyltransferase
VRSGDRVLDKPGLEVAPDLVPLVERPPRFVSRGGEKLSAALEAFPIRLEGRVCLDGGISTGGFTDCLLQRGAARVYGIDVGYGQTAWSLRTDPRVVLRERTNLRHLQPEGLYGPGDPWPDLAVADLSFISLRLVLPALRGLLRPGDSEAVVLVKPQFEVGRERVGKGGVVRDPAAHVDAIQAVITAAGPLGWNPAGVVASPITGPAGNQEYLLWLREAAGNPAASFDLAAVVRATGRRDSDGGAVPVAGADTDHGVDRADEDLAVTDLAGAGGVLDRIDDGVDPVVVDDHLELEFLQELDGELRAPITFDLTFLTAETAHLAHGHAHDAGVHQRDLDIFELEGANDGFDFFHGISEGFRSERWMAQDCSLSGSGKEGIRSIRSPAARASSSRRSAEGPDTWTWPAARRDQKASSKWVCSHSMPRGDCGLS